MNTKFKFFISLLFFFSLFIADAQSPEKEKNYKDIQVLPNPEQLKVDRNDLVSYKAKVDSFKLAFESKNEIKVNKFKTYLLSDMRKEFAESEAKIEQDEKAYKHSKEEYKLSKEYAKISKKDYKMSEDDKKDKQDYKRDKKVEKADKQKAKEYKRNYKDQKKLSSDMEDIIEDINEYDFKFSTEFEKDNEKHMELIVEFLELMEEDIEATEEDIKG